MSPLRDADTPTETRESSAPTALGAGMNGLLTNLKGVARAVRDGALWRPAHLGLLAASHLGRRANEAAGFVEADHLRAAAQWLARAQDATEDGGVAGRYRLSGGWSSSYPETTGYIVPTFLSLDGVFPGEGHRERARRCVDFLRSVQLGSGAFPGMEIAENRTEASTFNTGQILHGLTAWHRATGDAAVLASATSAAAWLSANQDADGAWTRFLYGTKRPYSYMAHASCWLAEFGEHTGDGTATDSARRHLEWVLRQVDPATGWIRRCGFFAGDGARETAHTHTIAYTIWGVLMLSRILHHDEGLAVASRAARAVARRVELSRTLPGMLDQEWRRAAGYTCLTGNAQMALIWFELDRLEPEPMLVSAGCKVIAEVMRAQPMRSRDPRIRGGIPGSDPVSGDYIQWALPNWAAKFFIDAVLAKRDAIGRLGFPSLAPIASASIPDGVPVRLPPAPVPHGPRPRIVLIADDVSPKVEQFHQAWQEWGFAPDAVVVRPTVEESVPKRLRAFARDHGMRRLALRLIRRSPATPEPPRRQGTIPTSGATAREYCERHAIPIVEVGSWVKVGDIARIRALAPGLIVYAGAGIMRGAILDLAPLGIVNAHMGLLPPMRGMNVAEWSAATGQVVGCTVHLIDEGIDTGDVLLFTPVDVAAADSVDHLRQIVDRAQITALGEVVQWVSAAGSLPPRRRQRADEGRQYFSMDAEVRGVFDAHLARSAGWPSIT